MSNETLMTGTDAANTNAGTTASQPATDVAAAPAAATGGQQQNNQEQGAAASEAAGAGDQGEQGNAAAKADGAPESYEFQVPEGVAFDDAGLQAFGEFAKDANLPQDKAQALLEKLAPAMQKRAADAMQAVRAEWEASAKSDQEIGGAKLAENLAVAKQALDTFGTPELRALLNESGLGNHPEIIRAFYRAGKAISEDKVVNGAGGQSPADPAKTLFPNQK